MQRPDLLRPTLIPGLLFGLVSAIPILGAGNCCCCLYLWACGWMAAFLHIREIRRRGSTALISDGAMAGLVAGLFAGFTAWVVSTLVDVLMGDQRREMLEQVLDQMRSSANASPEGMRVMEQVIAWLMDPGIGTRIFLLLVALFLFALISTLAGTLTAALMSRGPSPTAPPPAPPGWVGGGWPAPPPTGGTPTEGGGYPPAGGGFPQGGGSTPPPPGGVPPGGSPPPYSSSPGAGSEWGYGTEAMDLPLGSEDEPTQPPPGGGEPDKGGGSQSN